MISFIKGTSTIDAAALERALAQTPVGADGSSPGALRDPMLHSYCEPELFARLERQVAEACSTDRIRFHFL